jgi:hypothetical protein
MLGCNAIDNPIEHNRKLEESDESLLVDKDMYQCLVGKLIYLLHTCPDIACAVSLCIHPTSLIWK